jgi:hypothetical protein
MFGMFVLVALAIVIVGGLATVMWDRKGRQANILREKKAAQMAKVLQLFERARGRPPQDAEELTAWTRSAGGRAAMSLHLDKSGEIETD